jgi:hypothetical protein
MSEPSHLQIAHDALDECEQALEKLESMCCMPERSPRMQDLGQTFAAARERLDDAEEGSASETIAILEDAGAQVGWLQVGCCAPGRLPLYRVLLDELTTMQRSVNAAAGTGH